MTGEGLSLVPYERLSELLRLLTSKSTSEMHEGLILLKDQLSAANKPFKLLKFSRSVIYEYIAVYPELDHFTKLFSLIDQSEECEILCLPLLQVTYQLFETLNDKPDLSSIGIAFGIKLIDEHLNQFHRILDSSNNELIESTLILLTSICKFSISLARHLFHSFDLGSKTVLRLLGRRGKNQNMSLEVPPFLRRAVISFVLSFVYHSDSYLKGKILGNANCVYFCYSDLLKENSSFTIECLAALQDLIMLDGSVSRNMKISFFTGNKLFMQNVFELYFHPDKEVVHFLDSFLRRICLTPGKFLHFNDHENNILLKILLFLRPLDHEKMLKFFVDILKLCPELQKSIWNEKFFNLNLEGKEFVTIEFMASINLCLKIITLPIVSTPTDPFQYSLMTCCQSSLSRQLLGKLLSNSSLMVKYYAVLLCLALFDRFGRIINDKIITNSDELDEFNVQFHRRMPEFQAIQTIYNSISLSKSSISCQLLVTKLFCLIRFYLDYFQSSSFLEIKFDPFKYLLEKYDSITNDILLSLLPLLSVCPFKVLEKRNGKSVLRLIFNLFPNFPCLFEQLVDFVFKNKNISEPFECQQDLYFICLKVKENYTDKFIELIENSFSEYFKSKSILRIKPIVYQNEIQSIDRSLLIRSTCLNVRFISELFIKTAIEYLIRGNNILQSSSLLHLIFRIANKKQISSECLKIVLNEPNVVGLIGNNPHYSQLVENICNQRGVIFTFDLSNTYLSRVVVEKISNCLRNNSHLDESWFNLLFLIPNYDLFEEEKLLKLIIFPSLYLKTPILVQKYFLYLISNGNCDRFSFSKFALPFASDPFELFLRLIESQNLNFEDCLFEIISFNYQSLCYSIKNGDKLGIFQNTFHNYLNSIQQEDCPIPTSQSPLCCNNSLSNDEKLQLVQSFSGTTSQEDERIYHLIQQYESNGIYFGDFILFFSNSNFIINDQLLQLKNTILNLDFKLMKQTCSLFPFKNPKSILYNVDFLLNLIRLVLTCAVKLETVDNNFINLLIESNCVSLLSVCLCSQVERERLLALNSLHLFALLTSANDQFEFVNLALNNLQNLIDSSSTILPSFHAHFFAKSFSTLIQPDSLSFIFISKLFLKKPTVDLNNISYLVDLVWSCDKPVRIWFLELLSDGLKDEFSYKLYQNKKLIQYCMNGIDSLYLYLDSSHRELYFSILRNASLINPLDLVHYNGIFSWIYGQLIKNRLNNHFVSCNELLKLVIEIITNPIKLDSISLDCLGLILQEAFLIGNVDILIPLLQLIKRIGRVEREIGLMINPTLLSNIPKNQKTKHFLRQICLLYSNSSASCLTSDKILTEIYFSLNYL